MRRAVFVFGTLIVLATARAGFAGPDATTCKRVQKMLEMGRTTEDIVSTSAGTITEEDVDACKARFVHNQLAAGWPFPVAYG